jgi:TPR repeat protein
MAPQEEAHRIASHRIERALAPTCSMCMVSTVVRSLILVDAATQDPLPCLALPCLATCGTCGRSVGRSVGACLRLEAARWFAAAAAQGDADAQCWLGACHAEGRG